MKKKSRAAQSKKGSAALTEVELKLKIEPRGPDQNRIDRVARTLAEHPSVQ